MCERSADLAPTLCLSSLGYNLTFLKSESVESVHVILLPWWQSEDGGHLEQLRACGVWGGGSAPADKLSSCGAFLLQWNERYVRHAYANAQGLCLLAGPRQSSRTEAVPTCLPPPLHPEPHRPPLLALLCNSHGRPAAQQREAFILGHKAHQIQLFWKG